MLRDERVPINSHLSKMDKNVEDMFKELLAEANMSKNLSIKEEK